MISDMFDRTDHNGLPRHAWSRWAVRRTPGSTDDLVRLVAEFIIDYRCVGAPQYAAAWRRVVAGGEPYTNLEKRAIIAFIGPLLGEPARMLPDDQVEGAIAEHLWYLLVRSDPTDGVIFRVHGPKFHATAPGGDGLVIYDGETPSYRLWEIKKHAAAGHVSRTVRAAYVQLKASAEKYLAQYSAAGQESDDLHWARVYAGLLEHWANASTLAGAGIAIATSVAPLNCFSTYPAKFPDFPDKHCRSAILAGLDDLPSFANRVRELTWTGL